MKAQPNFSVAVYCASRTGTHMAYLEAAQQVGQWIGSHGGRLVYGGGNNGLMGAVATATLAAGGTVLGVIPQALVDKEVANYACTELQIVSTMHERKAIMADQSDAFLSLPGGIGTLEELFEIWSWRQLGYHNKPMGLLNVDHCYDGLITYLNQTVENGLMAEFQMALLKVDDQPARLLRTLVTEAGTADQQKAWVANL